jgi:hypothetical protein
MASQLKRMMFLISGLLVLQTANAAFAQGRMGMMMARQQMVMNDIDLNSPNTRRRNLHSRHSRDSQGLGCQTSSNCFQIPLSGSD